MGLKSQYQVSMKQAAKRKKKRRKMAAKGTDVKDYFYGKYYIKLGSS